MALPIWQIHQEILEAARGSSRFVLVAPTGSGKTTQLPQMLLDAGLAGERKIIVLQPRRVAARTVAARVAWERKSKLGGEIGYQIRFEDRTSLGTRVCFVTEGILLRWLQDDPLLSDISTIVFDEFHERNLLSDVSLGLVKHIQQTTRPDLRVVVMLRQLRSIWAIVRFLFQKGRHLALRSIISMNRMSVLLPSKQRMRLNRSSDLEILATFWFLCPVWARLMPPLVPVDRFGAASVLV
jgi:hypothetical protein